MSKSAYKPRSRVALDVPYDAWQGRAADIRRDLGIGRWDRETRVWRMTAESAGRLALACRVGGAWAAAEAIESQIPAPARPAHAAVLGAVARAAHALARRVCSLHDPKADYGVTFAEAMRELWRRVRTAGIEGLDRWWAYTGVTDAERRAEREARAARREAREAAEAAERAAEAAASLAAWEALADDRAAIRSHGTGRAGELLAGIAETVAKRGRATGRQLEVVRSMAEEARERAAARAERAAAGLSTCLTPCRGAPRVGYSYTRDGMTHTVISHGRKIRIDADTASTHGEGFLGYEGEWAVEITWQKRAVEAA